MSQQQKWVLDFEGFQINGNFYPLEICLINCENPTENIHVWHIGYSDTLAETYNNCNQTIRWQFHKHGMGWKHAEMTLVDALVELREVLEVENTKVQHEIHIKGLEKAKWIRGFFLREKDNVKVIEILNAPCFRDLTMFCGGAIGKACVFHQNSWHLRCPCRKAYYLVDYIA